MVSVNRSKNFLIWVLLTLILPFTLTRSSVALAQTPVAYEEVGIIETDDLDLLNPTGLAFSPADNTFFVLPTHLAPPQPQGTTTIVSITPFADLSGTVSIPATQVDPLNIAFDSQASRLLLFDAATNDLVEIKIGPAGLLDPTAITRIEAQPFGLQHPQGLAFDAEGRLFILDQAGPRLVRIEPDPAPGLDSATALEQGQVSEVDLKPLGLTDVRGLAFNPANDHLYLLSPATQTLYELTENGQLVTSHDLALLNLSDPQGLVFAPSRDTTDDPALINLFIADSGLNPTFTLTHQIYLPIIIKSSSTAPATIPDAAAGESQTGARPGQIVELSLTGPSLITPLAATVNATLVRTTHTSQFSPPSPDPSGLAYIPSSNTLLISDGEVDEMPQYFTGKNAFKTTLSGNLVGTLTTTSFSNEPAGVAYNPFNQHLYFSDDAKKKVFEVNPGVDGQYNTSDDIVTSFSTSAFGDMDPEGIAFDSWQGHLFMVDGVNEEVYRLTPGANGHFDGVSPAGDDQATHFDVTIMGLKDPEGIEFNPDNGHVYVLSGKKKLIAETTTSGMLIRLISISSLTSKTSAGLAYAPASGNPATKNLYIVDRGVDNGTNPNENDGKMYEFSFPPLPGEVTPPVASFTSSSPDNLGEVTAFTNTSSGGNLTFQWNFGDGSPLNTGNNPTHPYATSGTFSVVLTATNSAGSDTTSATVLIEDQPPAAEALYLSLANSGSYTVGGVAGVKDEDILSFAGANFAIVFDGSDVGVGGVDLDAFYVVDVDTILMSFNNSVTIGTLTVADADIVQFDATSLGTNTAGNFSMYFDGSDVGLDTSSEDIDAIELLPDGRLLISTSGNPSVPGVSGADEDLLAFTPATLGDNTSGAWAMYFDGSDVGLSTSSTEDVNGVAVATDGAIYLTTLGDFSVTGISGAGEDVFVCNPTSLGSTTACTFSAALFFDGSAWGLAGNDVDAINFQAP